MNQKPFNFQGTAGDSFFYIIISVLLVYVPIIGFGLSFNYTYKWIAQRSTVNGHKVAYSAGLGESTWFIWKNIFLTIITLGVYVFWFVPKQYAYIADHLSFVQEPTENTSQPVTA